jgi:ceramide glucosyltransferase
LDYPQYEVVFAVVDNGDPAKVIVEQLMTQFPHVDARLTVGGDGQSINPKINNMIPGYDAAKYDIVWICDSNAIVGNGTLKGMVECFDNKDVGLIHQVPRGMNAQNFSADLERIYYGTTHARMYIVANYLGITCTVGKSMLFRKSVLEKAGGLKALGKYLAEDYFIGVAIKKLGLKHIMYEEPVTQPLGECTFVDYALRRIRWTRLRKNMVPIATLLEPLSESISCGLIASYGVYKLWSIHPLNFLVFYLCSWFLCDLALIQSISCEPINDVKNFAIAWCVRELSYLPLYFYALCGNTVGWRGNCFVLRPGGFVIHEEQPKPDEARQKRAKFASFEWLEQLLNHPKCVTLTTSIIFSINFITEILYRSHRNGNPEYDSQPADSMEEPQKHRMKPSFGSTWQLLQLGLSMHLQNERNFYDTNYYQIPNRISKKSQKPTSY